jgi:hypothetical protein
LQITHVITEDEYKGRKIFDRLNLWIAQGGQWVRRTDEAGNIAARPCPNCWPRSAWPRSATTRNCAAKTSS